MSRRSPMGSTRTPEYVPWRSMIQRCENESCPSFAASTLHRRLTDGWPVDIALTVPAHGQRPTASLGGRRTKTEAAKDRSRSPLGRSQRLAALALARAALAAAGPRGEKLSRDAAEQIRARLSNGEVGAVIAREYGVSNNVISRIKRGLIWRVQ